MFTKQSKWNRCSLLLPSAIPPPHPNKGARTHTHEWLSSVTSSESNLLVWVFVHVVVVFHFLDVSLCLVLEFFVCNKHQCWLHRVSGRPRSLATAPAFAHNTVKQTQIEQLFNEHRPFLYWLPPPCNSIISVQTVCVRLMVGFAFFSFFFLFCFVSFLFFSFRNII